jgi:hypothetical protein
MQAQLVVLSYLHMQLHLLMLKIQIVFLELIMNIVLHID